MMAVIMEDNAKSTDDHKVYSQPTSSSSVIQRVPVICSLKCKKKESNQHKAVAPLGDVSAFSSDISMNHLYACTSETMVTFSDGVGYEDAKVQTNIVKDISYPVLGVHFPDNQNETDGFTLQFNLEFLESNFISSSIESGEIVAVTGPFVSNTEEDIRQNKESMGDVECDTKNNKINNSVPAKTFKNGRKRGRKLGYRSENTKDDFAHCGVCGGQVRDY